MSVLKILKFEDDEATLRKTSLLVSGFAMPLQKLIDDMIETAEAVDASGLAAPQVGVPMRIIVIRDMGQTYVYINPTITKSSGYIEMDEACLSLPGKIGRVGRPEKIEIDALDRYGKHIHIVPDILASRIIAHEIEHLDGGFFTDNLIGELRDAPPLDED